MHVFVLHAAAVKLPHGVHYFLKPREPIGLRRLTAFLHEVAKLGTCSHFTRRKEVILPLEAVEYSRNKWTAHLSEQTQLLTHKRNVLCRDLVVLQNDLARVATARGQE